MKAKELRILYLGTPKFSAYVLEGLISEGYNIVGLLSQPDKPIGRKHQIYPTPTKKVALAHNIPIFQFDRITDHEYILEDLKPDIIISCAYGQKTSNYFNNYPKYKAINVHGSYLPKLRGGAPIHHALIDGYDYSGITIMGMGDKMDAGPMFSRKKVEISDSDNFESLSNKLMVVARELLLETLPQIAENDLQPIEQNPEEVTFGFTIKKEDEKIDFNKSAREVFNLIRGLSPFIGAYCYLNNKKLKIYNAIVNENYSNKEPGSVLFNKKEMIVFCGSGSVSVLELQLEGKNKLDIAAFLNGNKEELKRLD